MSTLEETSGGVLRRGAPGDHLAGERARAERVAAARRRRRQWQIVGIRLASVATVLAVWQIFGARVDPVLFTTPA